MKNPIQYFARRFLGGSLWLLVLGMGLPCAHAGLTLTLDFYRSDQAEHFVFYTPLATNNLSPAAPLGTYIISAPNWPTNGSQRAFDLTTNGLADHNDLDSENGYSDFYSAVHDITNGFWSILFTNTTATNHYTFTVHSPNINSNALPAMVHLNPNDGTYLPTNLPTLTWIGPTNWGVFGQAELSGNSIYILTNIPANQTQWTVPLDPGLNYTFQLNYVTNYTTPLFTVSTPLNTNNSQPISGWSFTNRLETGNTTVFSVFTPTAAPTRGHTNEAFWTFDDNTLFTEDLSGNGNNVNGYSYFTISPAVTNDAAFGPYAGGFYGGGWLTPPTNLVDTLQGSFSVSLWVKTTNSPSYDYAEGTSGGGIVTANSDASEPMVLTGHKLAFETGANPPNTLHSAASINTGVYTHVVVTRDAFTGQKIVYINGVQDASDYAAPGLLTSSQNPELFIGENTYFQTDFIGSLDQIQIYSGVLSSNDVSFLFHNPGTNVANTSSANVSLPPVAVYDFANTNDLPGTDDSGNGNNANCGSGDNSPVDQDIYVTNAASGPYAQQFFGHNAFCFDPIGGAFTNLANALDGSFTVTAWVLTTASHGEDDDEAIFGNPVMFVDTSNTNLLVPLAITGSKLAFTISGPNGVDIQLHSTATINDGTYHFVGVTRNLTNGLIKLFVDGNLEASTTGPTNRLSLHSDIFVAGGYFGFYQGILDDVRIYGGELPPADLAQLAGNSIITLGAAVNAPTLPWTTYGDTLWFVETTNAYDTIAAAQSGPVTNDQISVISTTVIGPGTVTFAWASQANNQSGDADFQYEFDIDGDYNDSLEGNSDWQPDGPFPVPSGTHTLTWTAMSDGDMDPTEVGFLDQVVFTPNSPTVLQSPHINGSFFEFQFQTKSGFTYEVQYCTDLSVGNWQTYSFYGGNDSSYTVDISLSFFAPAKQGFVRVVPQ
jgi:hypothetical protein